MTYEQLIEWEAFYHLEPFGALADDYRMGVIAVAVGNATGSKTTDGAPLEPSHFYTSLKPSMTPEQREQFIAEKNASETRLMEHKLKRKNGQIERSKAKREKAQRELQNGRESS